MKRKKLRVVLEKWKEPKEPPPRLCVLCETTKPGHAFPDGVGKMGHPNICWPCAHPRKSPLFTSGSNWEVPVGGWVDASWMNAAWVVAQHLTGAY